MTRMLNGKEDNIKKIFWKINLLIMKKLYLVWTCLLVLKIDNKSVMTHYRKSHSVCITGVKEYVGAIDEECLQLYYLILFNFFYVLSSRNMWSREEFDMTFVQVHNTPLS